ncbi:MAG: DinB family protein [bacterium]|nr:DinB family protein [bacterium]
MKRSDLKDLPEFYDRYINKSPDVELLNALQISIDELSEIPLEKWKSIGSKTYTPGKWTIKDIIQHLIDTERTFNYRALAFARGEKQAMPFFTEDDYAFTANAEGRTIEELLDELKIVHQSSLSLFRSFTPEVLNRTGKGFKGDYSVAAIGFMLPGHQRWHFEVIEEKYSSLSELMKAD